MKWIGFEPDCCATAGRSPWIRNVSRAFAEPDNEFPFEATLILPSQDVDGETVTFRRVVLRGMYIVLDGCVHLKGALSTISAARRLQPGAM